MELILKEDVPPLGKAGDVVKVRDGYGRNFLLPQKKAILVSPGNLKALEAQKKMIEANLTKVRRKAQEVADRLNGFELTLAYKVGTHDRLFGSVTKMDISNALLKQGIQIDKHFLDLSAPIKTIGVYEVGVKLHPEVAASFKLWITRETK